MLLCASLCTISLNNLYRVKVVHFTDLDRIGFEPTTSGMQIQRSPN